MVYASMQSISVYGKADFIMENYGVIDLGSNSIRLVIYEVKNSHDDSEPAFRPIMDDKVIAGLSAYVKDGTFTKAGINKAAETLTELLMRSEYFSCKRLDIFATAVLRNCRNSSAAVADIEDAISRRIYLLSDREEADLGFIGAKLDKSMKRGTLVDLGGGSTELTRIAKGKNEDSVSLGMGCVSSYAQFVEVLLPTKKEEQNLRDAFLKQLEGVKDLSRYEADNMYGIGGSTRAAVKIYNTVISPGKNKKFVLALSDLDELISLMHSDTGAFAHALTKAVPERVHSCMPGIIILSTLMHELGGKTLDPCRYGLREGYLTERMLK